MHVYKTTLEWPAGPRYMTTRRKVSRCSSASLFVVLIMLLISLVFSLPLQAADVSRAGMNAYLSGTIDETERKIRSSELNTELSGLDAWIDDSEMAWKSKNFDDLNDQRLSFEVSLKNRRQVDAEQEILRMGNQELQIRSLRVLENRLKKRYLTLIDLVRQALRRNVLQQQHQQLKSERDTWKTRLASDDFNPGKLQQADVSLDNVWEQEIENNNRLKRSRKKIAHPIVINSRQGQMANLVSIQQMLDKTRSVLHSGAYEKYNPEISKARLSLGLASQKQKRNYAQQSLALSSLKLEYEKKDDTFAASVGVNIPLAKNNYDSRLNRQEVYYSKLELQNTLVEVEDQLKEKQFVLQQYQDEWQGLQRLKQKLNARLSRLQSIGNLELIQDLKSERVGYNKRENELIVLAFKQYVDFLHTAGMLAAKPYRNWLLAGTPRLRQ